MSSPFVIINTEEELRELIKNTVQEFELDSSSEESLEEMPIKQPVVKDIGIPGHSINKPFTLTQACGRFGDIIIDPRMLRSGMLVVKNLEGEEQLRIPCDSCLDRLLRMRQFNRNFKPTESTLKLFETLVDMSHLPPRRSRKIDRVHQVNKYRTGGTDQIDKPVKRIPVATKVAQSKPVTSQFVLTDTGRDHMLQEFERLLNRVKYLGDTTPETTNHMGNLIDLMLHKKYIGRSMARSLRKLF